MNNKAVCNSDGNTSPSLPPLDPSLQLSSLRQLDLYRWRAATVHPYGCPRSLQLIELSMPRSKLPPVPCLPGRHCISLKQQAISQRSPRKSSCGGGLLLCVPEYQGTSNSHNEWPFFNTKSPFLHGQFSILSAISIENSKRSWHLYCNSQYASSRSSPWLANEPPRCS